MPIDLLYPYNIISKEFLQTNTAGKGIVGKTVQWYLQNYLKNLFAGAFDREFETTPLPLDIPYASMSKVSEACKLITQAKRPLMILGSQSVLPPVGADKLRQAVEV